MVPPRILHLPDGRVLAYDDLGDPGAPVVVYLHGTPDSRLARHPDDRLLDRIGIRLVAVDRPGAGRSDAPPGTRSSLVADLEALADHLVTEQISLLGWSSGGLAALVAAASLGERIRSVVTVGTLPPVEAYADAEVLGAIGVRRRGFVELAIELLADGVPAADIAEEVAPHLVPDPIDAHIARDAVLEGAGTAGREDLATVPGAVEQMAAALVEAVHAGPGGLASLVAEQLSPGLDLGAISCPVVLWHGDRDDVSPPEVGRWIARRLPAAAVEVVAGSHHVLVARWEQILSGIVAAPEDHC